MNTAGHLEVMAVACRFVSVPSLMNVRGSRVHVLRKSVRGLVRSQDWPRAPPHASRRITIWNAAKLGPD